jgi:hypothetical protein
MRKRRNQHGLAEVCEQSVLRKFSVPGLCWFAYFLEGAMLFSQ